MLPNFLIIGSQKAGTTTLYHILQQHPQIYLSPTKEVNFFFLEERYQHGLNYYQTFFQKATPTARAIGEASPGYICHPQAAQRIAKVLPDVHLILTLREPISRAYSQYWDNRRRLIEPLTFRQAIEDYLTAEYRPGERGYFSRGVYLPYIRRFLEHFPRQQLLIVLFEDLRDKPQSVYRQIFEFLGVDADFLPQKLTTVFNAPSVYRNPWYHYCFTHPATQKKLPYLLRRLALIGKQDAFQYPLMDPKDRKRLQTFYRPHNQALAAFLKRDLPGWFYNQGVLKNCRLGAENRQLRGCSGII